MPFFCIMDTTEKTASQLKEQGSQTDAVFTAKQTTSKELEAREAYFKEYHNWESSSTLEDVHSLIYLIHEALDHGIASETVLAVFPHLHGMMQYIKLRD